MTVKIYHTQYGQIPVFVRADWDDPADPIQWSRDGEQWFWLRELSTVEQLQPREAMAAAVGEIAAEQVNDSVRAMRQVPRDEFWSFLRDLQERQL